MEKIMAKDLGRAKFIKESRIARAWPQAQLAKIADVTLRTIQRVERDGAASFETLKGIADAFGIDVKDLNPTSNVKMRRQVQPNIHFLNRIGSGKCLSDVVLGADQFQIEHDEAYDDKSLGAMKGILNLLRQDVVRLYDADPVSRLQIEGEMTQEIKGLEQFGFYLFGIKRSIPYLSGKQKSQIVMCTLYMSHSRSPKIKRDKKSNMVLPAALTEFIKQ